MIFFRGYHLFIAIIIMNYINRYKFNIICIILLLICTMYLSGCYTIPRPFRMNKTPDITKEMYDIAISHNTNDTNNYRLLKFLQKAARGEKLTIGFIGGSITEGYVSTEPSLTYARRTFLHIEDMFPKADFTYVNAGIAGTGSGIGVHRVNDDLLNENPDLVFIDASVNDNNTAHYQETYENLVRYILTSDKEPAVILLFMVDDSGNCATEVESEIGNAYNLPMIDYGAAINFTINNGLLSWEDIAGDYIHPNDKGHAIISELITTYIDDFYSENSSFMGKITDEMLASYGSETDYKSIPFVTKENYKNGKIVDFKDNPPDSYGSFLPYNGNAAFPNALKLTKETICSDEDLSFTVTAANIGLILESPAVEDAGYYDIYIDDEAYGFYSYQGFLICDVDIYSSNEVASHKVTIRRNPDYPDSELTILAVLLSE